MIGKVNIARKGGLNMEINGKLAKYTIDSGTISAGNFVKASGTGIAKASSTDTILGVANGEGSSGKTISVWVSNYA